MYTPLMTAVPRQTALITGASSGIGEALARTFARNGFDVVLTARRRDRLEALAAALEAEHGAHTTVIVADLTDPSAPAAIVAEVDKHGIQIDALVNNAGFTVNGLYEETTWEAQRDQLQVMAVAVCELTHRLLPGMVERRHGYILNIGSIVGVVPGFARPIYGGVKAMLVQFSRCLHADLKQAGVHVTVTLPGFTRTELKGIVATDGSSRVPKLLLLSAEQVAEESYRALMRNRDVYTPGRVYQILLFGVHWLPQSLFMRLQSSKKRRERVRRAANRPEGAALPRTRTNR